MSLPLRCHTMQLVPSVQDHQQRYLAHLIWRRSCGGTISRVSHAARQQSPDPQLQRPTCRSPGSSQLACGRQKAKAVNALGKLHHGRPGWRQTPNCHMAIHISKPHAHAQSAARLISSGSGQSIDASEEDSDCMTAVAVGATQGYWLRGSGYGFHGTRMRDTVDLAAGECQDWPLRTLDIDRRY